MSKSFPISFLFPEDFLAKELPASLEADWTEVGGASEGAVYSTLIALRERRSDIQAVSKWPERGIVIAHSRNLPKVRPTHWANLYIICWQIDYMRCDYAQMHIVPNKFMLTDSGLSIYDRLLLPGPSYVQHFPTEINLIPRDVRRGNAFAHIVYAGERKNLMKEFQTQEWQTHISHKLGLKLCIIDCPQEMGDYSQVDCVLAVRPPDQQVKQKPPSKLWNAWRAGVPAILGPEPGFRDYRKSELDYIEVETVGQALEALRKLRDNPEMRQAMVENGRKRAHECSLSTIIGEWNKFIEGPVLSHAAHWFEGPQFPKVVFGAARTIRMGIRSLRANLRTCMGYNRP